MSEIFLDSNVCVYAFDKTEPAKQEKALGLLENKPFISSQVIIETYLTCSRKLKLAESVCDENTTILGDITSIATIDEAVFVHALVVKERYKFSFLDSVIVATALRVLCHTLYSEDLQHGQKIEGKLHIVNPFR